MFLDGVYFFRGDFYFHKVSVLLHYIYIYIYIYYTYNYVSYTYFTAYVEVCVCFEISWLT